MNFAFFIHSLASDWNHGNAHFVRGVLADLVRRGHSITVYEQQDNWSRWHLARDHGDDATRAYLEVYPELRGLEHQYELQRDDVMHARDQLDLPNLLTEVDAVIVHEWTPPSVVQAIGDYRKTAGDFTLLFHDTHHRIVSEPQAMERFDLSGYDGVLAFGNVLREAYEQRGFAGRAWTWHEAADTHVFYPHDFDGEKQDLCWVGNWGDNERTAELHEFMLGPAKALGLTGTIHGVRYPDDAKQAVADAGLSYGGYLPNFRAPDLFARHHVTVHVPRRYYVTSLPGIPTIRPFEALACGIPLVSSPWSDAENLFRVGRDFLMVDNGAAMTDALRRITKEPAFAADLAAGGLETIKARHTCAHRTNELLAVLDELQPAIA